MIGSQCADTAGEPRTVSTEIRIAAHKDDDGSVEFAWQRSHPNAIWTDREFVGRLPAEALGFRFGEPVWYVSRRLTVEVTIALDGERLAAVSNQYFPALRKPLSLADWPAG